MTAASPRSVDRSARNLVPWCEWVSWKGGAWPDHVIVGSPLPSGKLCIEVTPASKLASISEELCIGCGICVKVGTCDGGWVGLVMHGEIFHYRNVHLKQYLSSIYQVTSKKTPPTVTLLTPSNFTDCRYLVWAKYLDWWGQMGLASPLLSKYWLEN